MPVVLERLLVSFFRIEDEDTRLFPYLETLTSLLPMCAEQVKDATPAILQRCLRLLQKTIHYHNNNNNVIDNAPTDHFLSR